MFRDTYERQAQHHTNDDEETNTSQKKKGRPRNERVPYKKLHPKSRTYERVIRSAHHNNLPNFIGQKFPREDDPDTYNFYLVCGPMLCTAVRGLFLVRNI